MEFSIDWIQDVSLNLIIKVVKEILGAAGWSFEHGEGKECVGEVSEHHVTSRYLNEIN